VLADISWQLVSFLDDGYEIEHTTCSQVTIKNRIIAKRFILNVMGFYPIY
jgi:hypothetical protein